MARATASLTGKARDRRQGRNAGGRRFGKKRSGGHKPGGRPASREPLGGVYSAPMDHSYRAVLQEHDGNTHIARPRPRQAISSGGSGSAG